MDNKEEDDDFDPKIIAKVTMSIAGFESEDEVKALLAAVVMACITHGLRLGPSTVELAIPKDLKKGPTDIKFDPSKFKN